MKPTAKPVAVDPGFQAPGRWDIDHGDSCDCVTLARAMGNGPETVDFMYCRQVLQKHWGVRCNHGGRVPEKRLSPQLPERDANDPVQAILVANVDLASR